MDPIVGEGAGYMYSEQSLKPRVFCAASTDRIENFHAAVFEIVVPFEFRNNQEYRTIENDLNVILQKEERLDKELTAGRFRAVFSTVKPRMAVAYHFFNDLDTWQDVYDEIRSTYDGPVTLAKDLLCWNVTEDGIKVREVVAQEAVWPAKSPFGTVPPTGDREELPPWLVDGIFEMEDVIKAYYERQGVGDIYEEQIPKK